MAKSNRVRVGEIMDVLRDALGPYVLAQFKARYRGKYLQEMEYLLYELNRPQHLPDEAAALEKLDIQSWLNLMNRKWNEVFRDKLSQTERNYISELRDARNKWAHQNAFSNDNAYRAADTAIRLLQAIGADKQAQAANVHAQQLLRQRFDRDAQKSARQSAALDDVLRTTTAGLKPWRLAIQPHEDVTSGRYTQAEFALDLSDVVQGKAAPEYGDAKEFFRRTYLTTGLKDLLVTGFQRLNGQGGDPVVQLQTNFGGGKTHSMLALYHLFGGAVKLEDLPQEADDIRGRIGAVNDSITARPAVIVGTAFDANEPRVHDDCTTYTLWGEIAWQLGGVKAYELVSNADIDRISPGSDTLRQLLENYGPALIIMDELIAFVRNLYGASVRPSAGSFDSVLTFMQALTEAVKRSSNSMLLVSIPASEAEVGSKGGKAALESLTKTIGRIESVWKPVSATESFEIVRRRLFSEVTDHAARDAVLSAFLDMYKQNSREFPAGAAEGEYYRRMQQAWPIHPELFARLYEDWSSLEHFQRTRGVLRLMAAVIHQLWTDHDQSLMIMPASMPLWKAKVRDEMLKYLPDGWPPVVDADIDGPDSKPFELDREVPQLGQHQASRRVARAIFVGSAPSVAAQNVRGIEEVRIRLATAQPGEKTAPFNDALRRMSSRLTYLYSDGSRYWYDTRPTVNRMAEDRARNLPEDEVHREAVGRLYSEEWSRDDFWAAHVAPETSADVADEARVRVVVLDPDAVHHKLGEESQAQQAARDILGNRGNTPRYYRNMLVFIAADKGNAEAWKNAVRDYLAWKSIDEQREELNLDVHQSKQVASALEEKEKTLLSRLQETYCWLIVPTQEDPKGPIDCQAHRIRGRESFYERAAKRLDREGLLIRRWSPDILRTELETVLWREEPHLGIKQLWEYLASYCWLPRLCDEKVLLEAIQDGVRRMDAPFAYATGVKDDGSYRGLALGQLVEPYFDDSELIVKPETAAEELAAQQPAQQIHQPGPSPEAASPLSEAAVTPAAPQPKARYYGRVALDPQRVNRDAGCIVEEVIQHLTSLTDTQVKITLEISARRPTGFDEATVRTISENSLTLKFDEHGFEE